MEVYIYAECFGKGEEPCIHDILLEGQAFCLTATQICKLLKQLKQTKHPEYGHFSQYADICDKVKLCEEITQIIERKNK
jgi:hypothetical protein